MKFSNTVRRREVAFMIRLLTIFGVVEQRQMRLLFDHMSNTNSVWVFFAWSVLRFREWLYAQPRAACWQPCC